MPARLPVYSRHFSVDVLFCHFLSAVDTTRSFVLFKNLSQCGSASLEKLLLFLETASNQVHPQPKDYWGHVNPIGPHACYDEGKHVAETLTYGFNHQDGVDVWVAHIFNTYVNPHDACVVSNFIVQVLCSKDMTVYGDGTQTHSFHSGCCIVELDIHDEAALMPLYKVFAAVHSDLSMVQELSLFVGDWDDELMLVIVVHFPRGRAKQGHHHWDGFLYTTPGIHTHLLPRDILHCPMAALYDQPVEFNRIAHLTLTNFKTSN
ncbi:uncharacterized protein F5891DRAFT_1256116 [Suillus fuscotomentosus]|uniref:NAD-dependent epimerase/dehydratase domain-containing protein n=1 Tax=Suillus fuscotomentosus TaxID=1912939 RepID=A0AAD4DV28_9AGAM|nr:uncharacterized protein F5891DRAFT_1256116 [Suillus fuscotomentosus]KAG1894369.1 hypothetical protein F5891DRAFT_1256116 [Suillus fuscotomentosus]